MIPAVFACVFVSAMGSTNTTWKEALVLAVCVTVFGIALFAYVLQIQIPILRGQSVISTALTDLWYGFGVALEPHNLLWCFVGVLVGNMVGVLPGMGVLVDHLDPAAADLRHEAGRRAILMLAGIYYGAQYGGAICSILLNLPCHPPHAVTCLDGYPMTKQGKGGIGARHHHDRLVRSAPRSASSEMIFLAPILAKIALEFGPAEDLLADAARPARRLDAGAGLAAQGRRDDGARPAARHRRHPTSRPGSPRFTFGIIELADGVEIVALALGLFGIAEFLNSVNKTAPINTKYAKVGSRDMRPSKADLKQAFLPMMRGTLIGSLCALIPGTGPTIASFVAYAAEKKISKTPERFGHGAIEGVACPEASTHSSVQGDFIPTMSLGIPGRRRDGAAARRADHPGHRARPAAHQRASRHLLGPDRELLDRQHHAGRPQRADDRHLGEAADHALPLSLSERAVLRLHRRLRRQQRHVPGRRDARASASSAMCCCCSASSRRRSCSASCSGRASRRTSAAPC